jgi:hypothetical protein
VNDVRIQCANSDRRWAHYRRGRKNLRSGTSSPVGRWELPGPATTKQRRRTDRPLERKAKLARWKPTLLAPATHSRNGREQEPAQEGQNCWQAWRNKRLSSSAGNRSQDGNSQAFHHAHSHRWKPRRCLAMPGRVPAGGRLPFSRCAISWFAMSRPKLAFFTQPARFPGARESQLFGLCSSSDNSVFRRIAPRRKIDR